MGAPVRSLLVPRGRCLRPCVRKAGETGRIISRASAHGNAELAPSVIRGGRLNQIASGLGNDNTVIGSTQRIRCAVLPSSTDTRSQGSTTPPRSRAIYWRIGQMLGTRPQPDPLKNRAALLASVTLDGDYSLLGLACQEQQQLEVPTPRMLSTLLPECPHSRPNLSGSDTIRWDRSA